MVVPTSAAHGGLACRILMQDDVTAPPKLMTGVVPVARIGRANGSAVWVVAQPTSVSTDTYGQLARLRDDARRGLGTDARPESDRFVGVLGNDEGRPVALVDLTVEQ